MMKKINQSKQKLINYLDIFIDSDYFQKSIYNLRKELEIPEGGFELLDETKKVLVKEKWIGDVFYMPEKLKRNREHVDDLINSFLQEADDKFQMVDAKINFIFKFYLFHNIRIYEMLEDRLDGVDLCGVESVTGSLDWYKSLEFSSDESIEYLRQQYEYYPVVIKLNSHVTQRDVVDYIKNNWTEISENLSYYKGQDSKLGKIKTRNSSVKKRNAFIYNNRDLPRKQIKEMVEKQFNKDLDYEYIGKIISEEKRRRKEV